MEVAESQTVVSQQDSKLGRVVSRRLLFDFLLLAPFIALFLCQLVRHEMWRDELNAWAIALASPTLKSLFAKLHYEAHPGAWYLLLWFVSRFTARAWAMKVVEGFIGLGTYAVIGFFSPFSRLEKALLFLSYFVSFEYTVLSRNYSICFLLVLVYVYRRCGRPDQARLNMLLLGIIANCDIIGVILSAGLFLEYAMQSTTESQRRDHFYSAALIYICLTVCAIASLIPAPDISWRTTGHILGNRWHPRYFVFSAVNYLVLSWFPISTSFPRHFWNPSALEHPAFYLIAFPFVAGALFVLFRRPLRLLILITVTACGAIAFGALFYVGTVRHFGIVFMAFLAALWIQRTTNFRSSLVRYFFLGLSALAGAQAGVAHWQHPFSNAGAAARWLRAQHLENSTLIGSPDTSIAAVAEQLNRPAYFLDCNCADTFLLFSARRDHFDPAEIPDRIAQAARRIPPANMILILNRPMSPSEKIGLKRKSLTSFLTAQFTGSEVPGEDFYLYRLNRLRLAS